MNRRFSISSPILLAALALPAGLFAQAEGNFQIHYATNLATSDTIITMSNSGSSWGTYFPIGGGYLQGNGGICVNIYAFSPDEQLQWCCMCGLAPNTLGSFSVQKDILPNVLTGAPQSNLVIKLVSTILGAVAIAPPSGSSIGTLGPPGCDATNINAGGNNPNSNNLLGGGLLAWGRDQINVSSPAGVENAFTNAQLSLAEVNMITKQCATNKVNGSGKGFCKSLHFPGTAPLNCSPIQ